MCQYACEAHHMAKNQDMGQFSDITTGGLFLLLFFLSRTNPVAKMGIVSFQKEQLSETLLLSCSREDRKSTRLNSSHQIISYAVFCLKKKKKKNYHRYR